MLLDSITLIQEYTPAYTLEISLAVKIYDLYIYNIIDTLLHSIHKWDLLDLVYYDPIHTKQLTPYMDHRFTIYFLSSSFILLNYQYGLTLLFYVTSADIFWTPVEHFVRISPTESYTYIQYILSGQTNFGYNYLIHKLNYSWPLPAVKRYEYDLGVKEESLLEHITDYITSQYLSGTLNDATFLFINQYCS